MRQLRGFLPWIAYPIVAGAFDWRVAAVVAFAVALAALLSATRTESLDMFAVTAVLFFAAVTAISVADPSSGIHRYVGALTPAALAAGAAISIARRQPFTIAFARRIAPPEFWDTPMFLHVNMVLTAVWATSFAAMSAVIAAVVTFHPQATGIILLAQIAGFVIPMRICRTYPATVRDRLAAA